MKIKELAVHFTETVEEEVALLVQEAGVLPVVDYLVKNDARVPIELKDLLVRLVGVVSELFSTDMPILSDNPEDTLRTISREINLSRILRERGMFRMYRLLRQRGNDGTLVWMSFRNPDNGQPFSRQEDFINWFCGSAGVSRSLLFQRISTIERMEGLQKETPDGPRAFTLDEIFQNILKKPHAMREVLNTVATWRGGELDHIEPEVAIQVARRVSPDRVPELEALAAQAVDNPEAMRTFNQAVLPILGELVEEVADHEKAGDALKFVRHDVLMRPEITYRWENDVLYVEVLEQALDPETGEVVLGVPVVVPFIPDTEALPQAVRDDLLRRLPIRNRLLLDL